jgi:hypothetical protein
LRFAKFICVFILLWEVGMSEAVVENLDARSQVSTDEWAIRQDLAAAYRLIAHYGWDDMVFTHLSARVPGPDDHFLLNPYGFQFSEVTQIW